MGSPAARKLEILHAIVKAYIDTGEPVASRSIARARKDQISPATVRNVMADLCDEGFLAQPHTSAGRIPTEKAFKSYIGSLASTNRLLTTELARVRAELSRADTLGQRVEKTSHILTEMTRGVGIAAAIPAATEQLHQIELLSLGENQVLMIVVTKDRSVRQKLVTLEAHLSQAELEPIRNFVNANFAGWLLSDIRAELGRRLEQDSAACDAMLATLTQLQQRGLFDIGADPEIHLEGAGNLVGVDLHLTREKMRELFHALEQKKRLLELLDRFLERGQTELAVQVGLGAAHPSMGELSLIGLTVVLPSGMCAKVAVLGPTRMDYSRVLSAVMNVGQALQSSST